MPGRMSAGKRLDTEKEGGDRGPRLPSTMKIAPEVPSGCTHYPCSGGFWRDLDVEAHDAQPPHQLVGVAALIQVVQVGGTQVPVFSTIGEHVIDRDQDLVR